MASKDICSGKSPWSGSVNEVRACIELSKLGLLPTGNREPVVNIVTLYQLAIQLPPGDPALTNSQALIEALKASSK